MKLPIPTVEHSNLSNLRHKQTQVQIPRSKKPPLREIQSGGLLTSHSHNSPGNSKV